MAFIKTCKKKCRKLKKKARKFARNINEYFEIDRRNALRMQPDNTQIRF